MITKLIPFTVAVFDIFLHDNFKSDYPGVEGWHRLHRRAGRWP
jgi:hypothetical protein